MTCQGSGAAPGTEPRTCETCGGSGQARTTRQEGNVTIQRVTTCKDCGGAGVFIDKPCPDCGGTGTSLEQQTLTVKVPKGAEEGMALRIPGRGEPEPQPGMPPGDLLLLIRTASDPDFRRDGADLWTSRSLSIPDAVLGAKARIRTLTGSLEIDIPPGTRPDSVLRLQGEGLPEFGTGRRGDLLVRTGIAGPAHLTNEERGLYEGLRKASSPDTRG
jgi:molecular chaperone DnaJ